MSILHCHVVFSSCNAYSAYALSLITLLYCFIDAVGLEATFTLPGARDLCHAARASRPRSSRRVALTHGTRPGPGTGHGPSPGSGRGPGPGAYLFKSINISTNGNFWILGWDNFQK